MSKRGLLLLGLSLIMLATTAMGCGRQRVAQRAIVVASGDSAQQRLLAALTVLALEADGYPVRQEAGLGDSARLRAALLAGSVDLVWDYTDVVWSERMGRDLPVAGSQELYMRLRQEDQRNGVEWLPPAPYKRQVGVVMLAALAQQRSLGTLDDFAVYARSRDASVTLCTTEALSQATGGLPGFAARYGLQLAPWRIQILSEEEILKALRRNECQAALWARAYDAAVERDLVLLRDNRGFFHASDLALAVRRVTLVEHAGLEKRLRDLSTLLTQEAMVSMEREVAKGANPLRVARRYLTDKRFIGSTRPTPTPSPAPTATLGL